MAFLKTPIEIDGTDYCCTAGGTTDFLYYGDAIDGGAYSELFRAEATGDSGDNPEAKSDRAYTGGVKFGVCCATGIKIDIWGKVETRHDNYDWIAIYLNGWEEVAYVSKATSLDYWDTATTGVSTITIALPDSPCGNIITVSGSTTDEKANNDVWWRFSINSLLP